MGIWHDYKVGEEKEKIAENENKTGIPHLNAYDSTEDFPEQYDNEPEEQNTYADKQEKEAIERLMNGE